MALSVDVGTFVLETGTGTKTTTVSLGGVTPEFIMLWTTYQTGTGFTSNYQFAAGFSDGTNDRSLNMFADPTLVFGPAGRASSNNLLQENNFGTRGLPVRLEVELSSFGADAFTLNYTRNDVATAHRVQYLVIGGADLTNVHVGDFEGPSTTSSQSNTDPGFRPDCMIVIDPFRSSTHPGPNVSAHTGIGFASGSGGAVTGQVVMHAMARHQGFPTTALRTIRDAQIISALNSGGIQNHEATLTSFDTNGFTLNWTKVETTTPTILYAVLKGGLYEVGAGIEPASEETTAYPVSGALTPKGVLLGSADMLPRTTQFSHGRFSFGASDNTSELSTWAGFTTGLAINSGDTQVDESHCLTITDVDSPSVVQSSAKVSSFAAGSFSLNWDKVGAGGGRQFTYLVIGDTPTGGAPQVVGITGIGPNEALGSPTMSPGTTTVSPAGIGPNEALGSPSMSPGTATVSTTGIGPNEALGSPQLNTFATITGIGPNEKLGSPSMSVGVTTVSITGISPNEKLGSPSFTIEGADQTISVVGITPNEKLGSPTMSPGLVAVTVTGIGPNEALGSPTMRPTINVAITGVGPNEKLGSPTMSPGVVTVSITGIGPNEKLGFPTLVLVTGNVFTGYLVVSNDPTSEGKLYTLDTGLYPSTAEYRFRFYIRTFSGAASPVVARVALRIGVNTFAAVASSEVQSSEKIDLDEIITGLIGVTAGSRQYRIEYGGASGAIVECGGGGFLVRVS